MLPLNKHTVSVLTHRYTNTHLRIYIHIKAHTNTETIIMHIPGVCKCTRMVIHFFYKFNPIRTNTKNCTIQHIYKPRHTNAQGAYTYPHTNTRTQCTDKSQMHTQYTHTLILTLSHTHMVTHNISTQTLQ